MTFIAEVKVWQDVKPTMVSPSLRAAVAQAELVLERSHNIRTVELDAVRQCGWSKIYRYYRLSIAKYRGCRLPHLKWCFVGGILVYLKAISGWWIDHGRPMIFGDWRLFSELWERRLFKAIYNYLHLFSHLVSCAIICNHLSICCERLV